jgi:parvulin-like peptidyl-prolyl isomerase
MLPRALVLAAALFGAGAAAQGIHPGDAVRVNGVVISNQRFHGFYIEYRNSKGVAVGARGDQLGLLVQLRREAMDRLVEQELAAQAAERAGITVDDSDVEAAVDELRSVFGDERSFELRLNDEGYTVQSYREHVARVMAGKRYLDEIRMATPPVSDEELEQYYHDNERRLTFPERVRVRHILLTWKPLGTKDDRAAIREQMRPILERARAGEDFAALAREFSDDYATKRHGGDTGLFQRGQMNPVFEQAAFALKSPGEISDPVETPFGVHIMRLEEHLQPHLVPLDEVREKLRAHIHEERTEAAVEADVERLRAEAEIEVLIPLGPRSTASTR